MVEHPLTGGGGSAPLQPTRGTQGVGVEAPLRAGDVASCTAPTRIDTLDKTALLVDRREQFPDGMGTRDE